MFLVFQPIDKRPNALSDFLRNSSTIVNKKTALANQYRFGDVIGRERRFPMKVVNCGGLFANYKRL